MLVSLLFSFCFSDCLCLLSWRLSSSYQRSVVFSSFINRPHTGTSSAHTTGKRLLWCELLFFCSRVSGLLLSSAAHSATHSSHSAAACVRCWNKVELSRAAAFGQPQTFGKLYSKQWFARGRTLKIWWTASRRLRRRCLVWTISSLLLVHAAMLIIPHLCRTGTFWSIFLGYFCLYYRDRETGNDMQ